VRLLHGAGDALMPLAAAQWLADALPDGRLSIFDDCGHAPFLSRPRDCAVLIESFADA
jgi:pimeloyl-[acyl-carrier protein] methyl ester esterase